MDRFDLAALGFAVALVLALPACRQIVGFDDGPSARIDASVGEGMEAGIDAAVEAGLDATVDAYVSPVDMDATLEAGSDADLDARAAPYTSHIGGSWIFVEREGARCLSPSSRL